MKNFTTHICFGQLSMTSQIHQFTQELLIFSWGFFKNIAYIFNEMRSIILLLGIFISCTTVNKTRVKAIPDWIKGRFRDDYGINYTINDTLFIMDGVAKYHIINWKENEQYLLARNDSTNKTDKGLYTRIDYTTFSGMAPFTWGYCFTVYNAKSTSAALQAAAADRANPKKGCNGYPFSRMKRLN